MIRYLGVNIPENLNMIIPENYNPLISKMKLDLSKRDLVPFLGLGQR